MCTEQNHFSKTHNLVKQIGCYSCLLDGVLRSHLVLWSKSNHTDREPNMFLQNTSGCVSYNTFTPVSPWCHKSTTALQFIGPVIFSSSVLRLLWDTSYYLLSLVIRRRISILLLEIVIMSECCWTSRVAFLFHSMLTCCCRRNGIIDNDGRL